MGVFERVRTYTGCKRGTDVMRKRNIERMALNSL